MGQAMSKNYFSIKIKYKIIDYFKPKIWGFGK